MNNRQDIEDAINEVSDRQKARSEALRLAISASKKIPYGPHGRATLLELAQAFYVFMIGKAP